MRISLSFLFSIDKSWVNEWVPFCSFLVLCIFLLNSWFSCQTRSSNFLRILVLIFWTFRTSCCTGWWFLQNFYLAWLVGFKVHGSCLHRVLLIWLINVWVDRFRPICLDFDVVNCWFWILIQKQRHPFDWIHLWVWSICSQTQSSVSSSYPGRVLTYLLLLWTSSSHFPAWTQLLQGCGLREGLGKGKGTAIGLSHAAWDVAVTETGVVVVVAGEVVGSVVHSKFKRSKIEYRIR